MNESTATLHELVPFARSLGMEALEWTPERVRVRLEWAEDRCTAGGVLHGGVIMALADTAGAACAYLNLPDTTSRTTTIESGTNFLRGVVEGHVEATAEPLHRGRSVIVVRTDVFDASGKHAAHVVQTQAVL